MSAGDDGEPWLYRVRQLIRIGAATAAGYDELRGGWRSPLPVMMDDHWALRPGTDAGRAELMWFMCVGRNPQVAEPVKARNAWPGLPDSTSCRPSGCM
jgi:hypothetical protein